MGKLKFEYVLFEEGRGLHSIQRARMIGGWMVVINAIEGVSSFFVPDPSHRWDISTPSDRTERIRIDDHDSSYLWTESSLSELTERFRIADQEAGDKEIAAP
jgi:hypothetical protein